MLKLSRNAIPALFGKAECHTGTSGDARGGMLAFRLGLDTAHLTTSCRLQVYRLKECPCIWCVYVNMVTFLLFMFCSVSLYIHNCCLIIAIWRPSCHKMHQIRFRPGLCPGPRCVSSRHSPDPLVGWGGEHPSPFPSPSILTPSAFIPPRFQCSATSFFHSLSTEYMYIQY